METLCDLDDHWADARLGQVIMAAAATFSATDWHYSLPCVRLALHQRYRRLKRYVGAFCAAVDRCMDIMQCSLRHQYAPQRISENWANPTVLAPLAASRL
jgi:hypothetical protein